VVLSLVVILPSVFVLVRSQAWDLIEQGVRGWLQENHGDKKVDLIVGRRSYTPTVLGERGN